MSNMLDYLRWRGDISLDAVPLTEVDGLILAQLAMPRWEKGLEDAAPLKELAARMAGQVVSDGYDPQSDGKLVALCGGSVRFGGAIVSDYVQDFDAVAEKQFAAVTLHLFPDMHYIAFRGTDSTIVGWQEDFNMAFSKPVPAQEAARDYLARIAGKYPGRLWVGGHSKGGNLAMYAATTVEGAVRERLEAVFNFDGPGLSDCMDAATLYARVAGRLRSFVPQGSIVGMLLAHPDAYAIVKSKSISIFQHDPYSWQVEGPGFVRMPELSGDSRRFEAGFRRWLAAQDEVSRAELVDTLFDVLRATDAQNFGREFWLGLAQNGRAVRKAIKDVGPEKAARVWKMITDLGKLSL